MKKLIATFALAGASMSASAQEMKNTQTPKMVVVDDCSIVYNDTLMTEDGSMICTSNSYNMCDSTVSTVSAAFYSNNSAISGAWHHKMSEVAELGEPDEKARLEQAFALYATKPKLD